MNNNINNTSRISRKLSVIDKSIKKIKELYSSCNLCNHRCGVNRDKNQKGRCKVEENHLFIKVSSSILHFGEEPMLVATNGSGTVFFSYCNLGCVFCQNYQISHNCIGDIISVEELADKFLELQDKKAVNINLVSPTHVIYPIVLALKIAFERGLTIPLVYNTNGYETVELIDALNGIVDIYLPDFKYGDNQKAIKYSGVKNYFENAIDVVKEMKKQVGYILLNKDNIAERGLIIRHLVLPNNEAASYDILLALKDNNFLDTTLSIMSQYSPEYKASSYELISNKLKLKEYEYVVDYAVYLGFSDILAQEIESSGHYLPNFKDTKTPFGN